MTPHDKLLALIDELERAKKCHVKKLKKLRVCAYHMYALAKLGYTVRHSFDGKTSTISWGGK